MSSQGEQMYSPLILKLETINSSQVKASAASPPAKVDTSTHLNASTTGHISFPHRKSKDDS
jgi:hypothetical protein